MNPWNYFYAALVVVVLYFLFPSQERMTNEDLIATLKTFGTQSPPPKTSKDPSEVPIYGPMGEKPDDSPSSTSGVSRLAPPASGDYPEIFGPDSVTVPGVQKKKADNGKHSSDGDVYDYNPDLAKAFPTSGPPEPYLTDFSKLHH
jgi:hypothetical protein